MTTSRLTELRAAIDGATSQAERLAALLALGQNLLENDPKQAVELGKESIELAERLKDSHGIANGMLLMGQADLERGNYRQAQEASQRALALYESLGDREGMAKTLGNFGRIYVRLGDYPTALEHHQRALALSEEQGYPVTTIRINMGVVYTQLGEYARALEQYQTALPLVEEGGDRLGLARVTANIAIVYEKLGEYTKALEQYRVALALVEELGNRTGIAIMTANIGALYGEIGDYAKALDQFQSAIGLYEEIGERTGIASSMGNIGLAYKELGEPAMALEQLQSALQLYEELGHPAGIASIIGDIGQLYAQKGFEVHDAARAEECFLRAIELMTEIGEGQTLYLIHMRLAELYEQQEKWKESHRHLRRYHELEAEVRSSEALRQARQMEHQRQIAEMEKRRAIERAEAREIELRAEILGAQLERKQQELTSTAMHLARQTERLGAFRNDLRSIIRNGSDPSQIVRRFNEKLKELPDSSIDWTKFEAEFQGTYPDFRTKLEERYPMLTKMEMRICSLVKVRLTTLNIAQLLCVSERTVESHRLNIRKKMELGRGEELYDLLSEI